MNRSLSSWILLGYLAVSFPLLLGIGLGQWSLIELTRHSKALVQDGSQVTQLGNRLRDDVTNLERTARQYVALGDNELLVLFYQRIARLDETLSLMRDHGLDRDFGFSLVTMRGQLAELVRQWNKGLQSGNELSQAIQGVRQLGEQAEKLVKAGHASIKRETGNLQRAAATARQRMLICALGLVPVALLAIWLLMRRLRRALASLRQAISVIGHGHQDRPIRVEGPRELVEVGERLDWLRRRLAELEGEKDRFLRHVSHELKTPLASLREAADLMGHDSVGILNPQQVELRSILLESADELHEQIAHLLAYAAWRREQKRQRATKLTAAEFADDLHGRFELQMQRHGLQWQPDIRCELIHGQPARLQEATENLISNAIKHAPRDSAIEFGLCCVDGHFELSVRDHGAGVPDNEKDIIFEPFQRGHQTHEQGIPGTGVGLSIVSECALAHSGEVFVEDAQPGSRFVFRWPDQS